MQLFSVPPEYERNGLPRESVVELQMIGSGDVGAAGELGYDPAATASLRRFQAIQIATECVFAETAIMWGCPEWSQELDWEANLDRWLPTFRVFTCVSEEYALDGLVLEFPGSYGDTVERLGQTTRRTLCYVSVNDPAGADCMAAEIEDPDWWFSFDGQKLFILTFGSCYPRSSSRYGFETDHTCQPSRHAGTSNPHGWVNRRCGGGKNGNDLEPDPDPHQVPSG